ncbi:MAG: hypothetical protein ACMUFK_03380 [Thermoplasmatota archaeon]
MDLKRIVTLDVVRGSCILGMVALHVFSAIFDRSWIGTEEMANKTLLDIVFLLTLAYIGGMAGLFLMVSIISHTISIRHQIGSGKKLADVMVRQIMGGLLLLLFAFIVESAIGHYGFIGRMAYWDPLGDISFSTQVSENLPRLYYRGFHFMTLHTIAWSIIINSIVQWVMYRKGGFIKDKRNVGIFGILSLMVLILTPLAWWFAGTVVDGYPYATYPGTDRMVQYPLAGVTGLFDLVKLFFLGPLAGQTEPLFPFLSIAFIGSIIGIYLTQEKQPSGFCTRGIKTGITFLALGILGIFLVWELHFDSWTNFTRNPFDIMKLGIWLPVILFTTGGQIIVLFLLLRLVEFREASYRFAERTKILRRFGAVSLTIYTFQYIDAFPRFLLTLIPGVEVFGDRDGMITSIIVTIIVLGFWNVLLMLWSKVRFIGSAEWLFSVILSRLGKLSFKRGESTLKKEKWYYVPRLDLFTGKNEVDWMDLSEKGIKEESEVRDSRLSYWLSIAGLVLMPLAVVSYFISRKLMEKEQCNRLSRLSQKISKLGIVIGVIKLLILAVTRNVVLN